MGNVLQFSADHHAGWPLCKLWEHRFSVPDLVSPPRPPPRRILCGKFCFSGRLRPQEQPILAFDVECWKYQAVGRALKTRGMIATLARARTWRCPVWRPVERWWKVRLGQDRASRPKKIPPWFRQGRQETQRSKSHHLGHPYLLVRLWILREQRLMWPWPADLSVPNVSSGRVRLADLRSCRAVLSQSPS